MSKLSSIALLTNNISKKNNSVKKEIVKKERKYSDQELTNWTKEFFDEWKMGVTFLSRTSGDFPPSEFENLYKYYEDFAKEFEDKLKSKSFSRQKSSVDDFIQEFWYEVADVAVEEIGSKIDSFINIMDDIYKSIDKYSEMIRNKSEKIKSKANPANEDEQWIYDNCYDMVKQLAKDYMEKQLDAYIPKFQQIKERFDAIGENLGD